MAVPDHEEASRILAGRRLPEGIVRHSEGVSRVSVAAARMVEAAGIPVDVAVVEAAALLHDIDKLTTRRTGGPHGEVARGCSRRWDSVSLPLRSRRIR